jgi:hypothetical protein
MFRRISFFLAVMCMFECSLIKFTYADKTETFDSAASAMSHGWTATGSGGGGGTVGWINTNDSGGAGAGELQFDVNRGPELAYLDTNLGMTINGSMPFSMTGKLNYLGNANSPNDNPDVGFPPILGFSTTVNDYVGIMFRSDEDVFPHQLAWGIRLESDPAGGIQFNSGGDESRIMAPNVPRTFSLAYDPTEGSFGTIRASVSDAGGPVARFLTQGERNLLNYTRAGIAKRGNAVGLDGFQLRLDDLTYTGMATTPQGVDGDYNNNGVVDAADYALWRNGGPLQNEIATVGNVTPEDYTEWMARFGNVSGSGAGLYGAAVPEPGTILLPLFGWSAITSIIRRGQR